MNNLTIIQQEGKLLVESRQVAEMVDKNHKELLRDIRGYVDIMENSGERKIAPSDFFIESTYVSDQNKTLPCYLITKQGCEMIANKMTGEKGILFTAAYVTKFNEMEIQVTNPVKLTPQPRYRARMISTAVKDVDATAKQLMKLFAVKDGIAYAAAVNMVENTYQMDMSPVKRLLPAAQHETGFLNPTQIGQKIGLNAVKTNQLLAEKGLQAKINGEWRLTDAGKQYAEEMPYTRNGHSGYQIQWNEAVLSSLTNGVFN